MSALQTITLLIAIITIGRLFSFAVAFLQRERVSITVAIVEIGDTVTGRAEFHEFDDMRDAVAFAQDVTESIRIQYNLEPEQVHVWNNMFLAERDYIILHSVD